jgi:hypothetical protein
MLGWLWYPIEKLRQFIYLGMVVLGVILIGFELRPMWAHLITKLLSSPMGFAQEFISLFSGVPYLLLIQLFCVVMVMILAFIFR